MVHNSYLLGSSNRNKSYCFSKDFDLINQFDTGIIPDIAKRPLFNNEMKYIPLSYSNVLLLMSYFNEIVLYVVNFEENKTYKYHVSSPYGANENYIINSASLLEKEDMYYLIECQLTAYSGEKKTIKIKITPSEQSAMIME